MKTTLRASKLQLKGIMPGKTDAFPALRNPIRSEIKASLREDDGLFLHYGIMDYTLPYAMQDDYDTADFIMEEIKKYKYTKEVQAFVDELAGQILNMESDNAMDTIERVKEIL